MIAGAEAAMSTDEKMDDPTVARLQHDLDSMQSHLTVLKSSAETMLTEANTSAKRPRLADNVDLTGDDGHGAAPAGSPALEPFGSARK